MPDVSSVSRERGTEREGEALSRRLGLLNLVDCAQHGSPICSAPAESLGGRSHGDVNASFEMSQTPPCSCVLISSTYYRFGRHHFDLIQEAKN